MKRLSTLFLFAFCANFAFAQTPSDYHINTVFKNYGKRSGGYGAIGNKFTTIDGQFANMVDVYGGWYINHWFLLGIGASATTNNINVDPQYAAIPGIDMTYQYGQFGLMTEYVIANHRAVHVAFQMFAGTGFTLQYDRYGWQNNDWQRDRTYDENWFMVAEPGVQVEINILRWMRLSPGVSYRQVFNSDAAGLSDSKLSAPSFNVSLKFGKF